MAIKRFVYIHPFGNFREDDDQEDESFAAPSEVATWAKILFDDGATKLADGYRHDKNSFVEAF